MPARSPWRAIQGLPLTCTISFASARECRPQTLTARTPPPDNPPYRRRSERTQGAVVRRHCVVQAAERRARRGGGGSDVGYAVGGEGALLKTVNAAEVGQLTWQTLDSGLTNPSRITFTAITCACPVFPAASETPSGAGLRVVVGAWRVTLTCGDTLLRVQSVCRFVCGAVLGGGLAGHAASYHRRWHHMAAAPTIDVAVAGIGQLLPLLPRARVNAGGSSAMVEMARFRSGQGFVSISHAHLTGTFIHGRRTCTTSRW
jgi:hypothetical protein